MVGCSRRSCRSCLRSSRRDLLRRRFASAERFVSRVRSILMQHKRRRGDVTGLTPPRAASGWLARRLVACLAASRARMPADTDQQELWLQRRGVQLKDWPAANGGLDPGASHQATRSPMRRFRVRAMRFQSRGSRHRWTSRGPATFYLAGRCAGDRAGDRARGLQHEHV